MPNWLEFLLYLVAFGCFLLAALSVIVHTRLNLIGAGLMFWVLVPLLNAFDALT